MLLETPKLEQFIVIFAYNAPGNQPCRERLIYPAGGMSEIRDGKDL